MRDANLSNTNLPGKNAAAEPELSAARRRIITTVVEQLSAGRDSGNLFQRVPSSRSTRVAKVSLPAGQTGSGEYDSVDEYYVKVFCYRSLTDAVKQLVRGSRAKRSCVAARELQAVGLRTPSVLGYGALAPGVSWLLTREVPAVGLGNYLDNFLRPPLSAKKLRWKWRVLQALGRAVGRMHNAGIVHGDLRLNNILIDSKADEPTFYIIDNERNRRYHRPVPRRMLVKNLVQLTLMHPRYGSRADRLRVLDAYLDAFECFDRRGLGRLIAEVERLSAQRQRKLERKRIHRIQLSAEQVSNVPD
jgi:hypothetical protein